MANDGKLSAFKHEGFWQPLDTLRDKNELEKLWEARKRHGSYGFDRSKILAR